jgi:hypothetical protein
MEIIKMFAEYQAKHKVHVSAVDATNAADKMRKKAFFANSELKRFRKMFDTFAEVVPGYTVKERRSETKSLSTFGGVRVKDLSFRDAQTKFNHFTKAGMDVCLCDTNGDVLMAAGLYLNYRLEMEAVLYVGYLPVARKFRPPYASRELSISERMFSELFDIERWWTVRAPNMERMEFEACARQPSDMFIAAHSIGALMSPQALREEYSRVEKHLAIYAVGIKAVQSVANA